MTISEDMLNRLVLQMSNLVVKQERLIVSQENLVKMVEDHERQIHGNGQDGLKSDMVLVKAQLKNSRWFERAFWVALLGGAGAWIFKGH